MAVNNQLDVPSAHTSPLGRWRTPLSASTSSRLALLLLGFFAAAVLLQLVSGAYHSEFGGYPDEPAHYVTSLMVREYLTSSQLLSPLQFATDYYHHYPKVAFGHWPPLFYLVQAVWMLLFSSSRASILLELAATAALLAYAVFLEARHWFGWKAGALAGLLTVFLPLIQTYTDEEMAETLLVLTCFWSVIFFARYLDSERWQDSVAFGVFFALAVLTKGSGWLLTLVPPIALIFTRKLRILLRPGFWLAVLIVAALCLPWQLTTMRWAEQGWTGGTGPSLHYTLAALWQFLPMLVQITGTVLAVLTALGILVEVILPVFRKPVASAPAVMFALILADWLFHSLVPAGVEDRKLIIAVPALILFLFAGGFWIADRLPLRGGLRRWRYSFVAAAAAAVFFWQTFSVPHETHYGYNEVATFITSDPRLRGATILVSSGAIGEGLLVSEIAMREPHPTDTILRGTKVLAQMDWEGAHYRSFFSNPTELVDYLDRNQVGFVVTDNFTPASALPHNEALRRTIRQSGRFQPIGRFRPSQGNPAANIEVFRFDPR